MLFARSKVSNLTSFAVACALLLFGPRGLAAEGSIVLAPDGSYRVDSLVITRLAVGYWSGYTGTRYSTYLDGHSVLEDVATRCGQPIKFRQSESGPASTYWDVGDAMGGCVSDFVANYISRPHTISTMLPPQLKPKSSGTPYYEPSAGEWWEWKARVYGEPYFRDAYSATFELRGLPTILFCSVDAPIRSADTGACSCPGEVKYSAMARGYRCFPREYYRLEITTITPGGSLPDIELEPEETVSLMVQVFDAEDRPVPFVHVRIEVSVEATSGGHDHGGADRPRGALSGFNGANWVEGATDVFGSYYFSFTAPKASGDHRLRVACVSNVCDDEEKKVWVGLRGLVALPPSVYGYYEFVGGVDDGENKHFPNSDTHYLTLTSAAVAITLAAAYRQKFPEDPALRYNDASLERGGIFDIKANWSPSHAEHRRGTVIDVRANPIINSVTAIPDRNFDQFIKLTRRFAPAYAEIHYQGTDVQHFHVRLMGEME